MLRLVVFLILLQHAHSFCMVTPDRDGHVNATALSAKLNGSTIIGTTSTTNYYAPTSFYGCTTLTSIDIPASVKTIGYYAFRDSYVAKVSYDGTDMSLSVLKEKLGTRAYNSGADTTGVTVSGSGWIVYAFYDTPYADCPLADKTASHGIFIYGDESDKYEYCKWLTSVTIQSSVAKIHYNAFYKAPALTSVDFSEATSLKTIGAQAFRYATALKSVDFSGATKLTEIGTSAFYETALTSVTIPSSVTDIRGYAFYKTTALKSVDFSGATALTEIGASAFAYTTALTSIDFSNATALEEIGASAFQSATNLISVTIPNSVISIGNYAFRYATALTSVDFSGATALETIGSQAFFYATALTSVTLPDGLETIVSGAFYYNNLATVIIPESVKTIGGTGDYAYGAFVYNDITELAILGTPTFDEYTSSTDFYRTFQRKAPYGPIQLKRFCGNYSALPSNIQAQISMTHAVTDCTFWCATGSVQISTNYNCTKQWSTSCAAGSYLAPKPAGMQVAMSDTCTPCPAGTYQPDDNSNATECTTCPTGMFQPNSSSVACTPWSLSTCPQGQYFITGSTTVDATCEVCAPGAYQPDDNSNATSCTHFTTGNDRRLIAVGTRTADYVWGDVPILGPSALKTAWSNMNCSGGQMYQREPGNCTVGRICFTDGDVLECPTDAVRLNATHCSSRKSDVHSTLQRFCPL